MDKRIKQYGKYAYDHLNKEDIKDFKLEFPYAYGTIDGFTYKVHLEKMIEGIPSEYTKEMYNEKFFNDGRQRFDAVEWSDMMDLDNRFLLSGEIIDVKLDNNSVEHKILNNILNCDKDNLNEALKYTAFLLKDIREEAMDIGFKQGVEQGIYMEQEKAYKKKRLKDEE